MKEGNGGGYNCEVEKDSISLLLERTPNLDGDGKEIAFRGAKVTAVAWMCPPKVHVKIHICKYLEF